MKFNTERNRETLIESFKCLKTDENFIVLGESTLLYNSIAWAMGYTDRWVVILDSKELPSIDISTIEGYWPQNVPYSRSPIHLVRAFRAEGFEETRNSYYEKGYDKVALYKRRKSISCREEWTHASRIVSDEVEQSKLGSSFNVAHSRNIFSEGANTLPIKKGDCVLCNIINGLYLIIKGLYRFLTLPSLKKETDYGEVFTYMKRVDEKEKFREDYLKMCEDEGVIKDESEQNLNSKQDSEYEVPIIVNEEIIKKRFKELS